MSKQSNQDTYRVTVSEIEPIVIRWFESNSHFNIDDNLKNIVGDYSKQDEEWVRKSKALVLCCLLTMQESKILKKAKVEDKEYWVLAQRFDDLVETVQINMQTKSKFFAVSDRVTDVINMIGSMSGVEDGLSEGDTPQEACMVVLNNETVSDFLAKVNIFLTVFIGMAKKANENSDS